MKDKQLHSISDKAEYTEVYHHIMKVASEFSRISGNTPRNLIEVTQHIHGRFDEAAYHAFRASNTFDIDRKISEINLARECIFFQYSSLEYLVKTRASSIGAANKVIDELTEIYNQLGKWYRKELSMKAKQEQEI